MLLKRCVRRLKSSFFYRTQRFHSRTSIMLDRIKEATRWRQKDTWHRIAASFFDSQSVVVDLGCGHGEFLRYAPNRAIGLDWNEDNLRIAAQSGRRVVKADVRALPFEDAAIDGVHCSHVLEHLIPKDVHRVLTEIDRVLKPGGIVVLQTPLMWSDFWSDLTHVRPYPPEAILHYLGSDSEPRTLPRMETRYEVIQLRWRYAPLRLHIRLIDGVLHRLNRWGFPWLKKSGYMLVIVKK